MRAEVYEMGNYTVVLNKQGKFNLGQLEEYKADITKYANNGYLLSDFNDDTWKFSTSNQFHYLNFNLGNHEQNTLLRCFAIECLNKGMNVKTIRKYSDYIKKTIRHTAFYSLEKFEEYEEWLVENASYVFLKEIHYAHKAFFKFYEPTNHQSYQKLYEGLYTNNYAVRELPPYKDVLYFDHCNNDFEQISNGLLRKKYLPIFIWWKLTKIIPMRTSELIAIKKNDITETDNGMVLEINRVKSDLTYSVPIQTTFSIGEDVANLIREYLSIHDEVTITADVTEEEKSYLFPYYIFSENKLNAHSRKLSKILKNDITMHITVSAINKLLKDFYVEIINPHYNLTLAELSIMDTRHLAICGLKMQGFSPLTIARLAGHTTLESQNHYLSHIEVFNEAATNVLAESIVRETLFNTNNPAAPKQLKHNILKSELINTESISYMKLENGYCTDDNFPANCQMSCESCLFFIFSPQKQEQKRALLEYSDKLAEQKESAIALFKAIHESLISHTNARDMLEDINQLNAYKSQTELIKRIVEQHAVIKSKILLEDHQQWLDHKNTLTFF